MLSTSQTQSQACQMFYTPFPTQKKNTKTFIVLYQFMVIPSLNVYIFLKASWLNNGL